MQRPHFPDPMEIVEDSLAQATKAHRDPREPGLTVREKIDIAIDQGFDDPNFTAEDVALTAGVSDRRVRQVLAEGSPGTTLRAEVQERRMAKARQLLLSSSYTIEQVAYLCGFKDASSFSTNFRAQHGVTPKGWRTHYGRAKRAGGTTGCFRKASERARAKREGKPLPSMTHETLSEGDRAVMGHEMDHAFRKARIRGRLADRASIAELAKVWMERSA